jgi:hypothetical protein
VRRPRLLRNWAVRPEDSVLKLEEIAHRILDQGEDPKAIAGSIDDVPQAGNWRRAGAEFIMTDLELDFIDRRNLLIIRFLVSR